MAALEEQIIKRPRVGLAAIAIQEGKVLLGKRKGLIGDATWAPPGGHLEYGESVDACAARELLEETGLVAKKMVQGPYTNDLIAPKNHHYITLFVIIPEFEGEVERREPQKCLGWEWFSLDALPSPLMTPFATFMETHSSLLMYELL